jgi:transketolase
MDAVQKANSGHPGAPMGMADIAEVLWRDVLKFNPGNPTWANRDRFVLSNGHASMLLYAVLNLTGYPLAMEELQNFRQFGSKTAGHPERELHVGIETTTGPLGQGISNAVGMAMAERSLAHAFNRPGHEIVDHHTYVFLGDGCMMEGISHEVCSFAGMQRLGKLIAVYDNNGISIDGKVVGWFDDDTAKRFEAYGWHVVPRVDGHDSAAIAAALAAARTVTDRPSLICAQTIIGFPAPKQGTQTMHGEAMGAEDIAATRKTMGWTAPPFEIPPDIRAAWDHREQGAKAEQEWRTRFRAYAQEFPALGVEFERRMAGDLPEGFDDLARAFTAKVQAEGKVLATRQSSQATLNALGPAVPELLGGSADLTPSNGTLRKDSVSLNPAAPGGNYLHYGVREFGMSGVMNGMTAHGGFIPYGGTFLTFSDYARNAIRMACLMRLRVIYVYTHDSIGLGEDGPTHQPVEHLAALRVIPHIDVWRPCDGVEAAAGWHAALGNRNGPTLLILTRQACVHQARDAAQVANIARGGYVLIDGGGTPEAIVIATGSEVGIAAEAVRVMNGKGRKVRLVSMPSTNTFDAQDAAYKESVLPAAVTRRVAVEAGVRAAWWQYVGLEGEIVGIDHFGASAPAKDLFQRFGFTPDKVVEAIGKVLKLRV